VTCPKKDLDHLSNLLAVNPRVRIMPLDERKHIVFHTVRGVVNALALAALAYALSHLLFRQYWIAFFGNISAFSLGSVAIIYLLSEFSLLRTGLGWVETLVWPALYGYAYLQSYELIYHFSFPIYLNYFQLPILNGEGFRFLLERFLTIIPVVLIRKYLSYTKLTIGFLMIFVMIWIVWILYGFPQYFHEGYFYPQILRTNDAFAYSLMFNFSSKLVLAACFISLLNIDLTLCPVLKRILTK
jgi:hypothetical protein